MASDHLLGQNPVVIAHSRHQTQEAQDRQRHRFVAVLATVAVVIDANDLRGVVVPRKLLLGQGQNVRMVSPNPYRGSSAAAANRRRATSAHHVEKYPLPK